MKPFNLEKYLINPSCKIVTRAGRPVRIICTDAKGKYPVIALISNKNGDEASFEFTKDGLWNENCENSLDLFFAPIKKEGWVNIYKGVNEKYPSYLGQSIYKSEEEALKNKCNDKYITTIKIEWEE